MRILHVGNGNYKHDGEKFYDVGRKLNNGLIREGHNVYFFSDRDTARASNIFSSSRLSSGKCNDQFVKICENFQPELILLGHADIIKAESLKNVRDIIPDVKIAQFNVDIIFAPVNIASIKSKLDVVDTTFITTAGEALKKFSSEKGKVRFMPNPVDISMESIKCHEKDDQENDVFWALRATKGSFEGDPRIEYPLYLESSNELNVDYHGMNGKGELFGNDYYKAIANNKMGLNISVNRVNGDYPLADDAHIYIYSSDRISHYMGCGLLTFAAKRNRLDKMFVEDKEIVLFDSKEELLEKVLYYKKNDKARKEVAKNGYEKYHAEFNERLIARYIIESTFEQNYSYEYQWPTEAY